MPCFTPEQLDELGINLEKLPEKVATSSCQIASDYLEGASTEYQSSFSTLTLKVPNIYHKDTSAFSYLNDVVWDEGGSTTPNLITTDLLG